MDRQFYSTDSMKVLDDNYDFDKETPDGRTITIFDLDEKSPKKEPPFWEDPDFWITLVITLVLYFDFSF